MFAKLLRNTTKFSLGTSRLHESISNEYDILSLAEEAPLSTSRVVYLCPFNDSIRMAIHFGKVTL